MNVALMFMLILVTPVTAEIDHLGAISDGFVHSAVADIVKEPIDNALSPTLVNYYICKDSGFPLEVIQSKEKCYTDVLDYIIVKPPNIILVFLYNMVVILFMAMFVIWCCVSSAEEKSEVCTYIICHMIGQIIYDVLCGDDDD